MTSCITDPWAPWSDEIGKAFTQPGPGMAKTIKQDGLYVDLASGTDGCAYYLSDSGYLTTSTQEHEEWFDRKLKKEEAENKEKVDSIISHFYTRK